ncbi:MAG: hypothetical protein LBE21_05670 [Pseudomonadales bacterium]|jgi:predicted exporter|nr:hypothetical protein [Pseudomonadales bacterium]
MKKSARMASERWLPRAFLGLLFLLCCALVWQCRENWPISTDLLTLLPQQQLDPMEQEAQARVQAPLSRQLLVLIGGGDTEQAVIQAKALSERWSANALFSSVQAGLPVDLESLRRALLAGRIAMLPAADRQLLESEPERYARQRIQDIVDPFASAGLIPLDSDWLGLTKKIEQALRPEGNVQLDIASGTLQARYADEDWVLVMAQTQADAFDQGGSSRGIAALVAEEQAQLQAQGLRMLALGGVLYADVGRTQAIKESILIGTGSVLGIVLTLLLALRGWRALLAFTAVACGMLAGFVACVALFGGIHVLTLVVGTSLIGIAIDFPMHWLGKSFGMPDWRGWPVLWRVLPGLSISLAANLVGYLALAFTPFPGLTQIAVFSSAGVLGAYACTVCLLPGWMRQWCPRPAPALLHFAEHWLRWRDYLASRRPLWYGGGGILLAVFAGGLMRVDLRDDLRQWLGVPDDLLGQAVEVGTITGYIPTSQFFLVRAPDEAALLERQAQITRALTPLQAADGLTSFLALSQVAAPVPLQRQTQARLAQLALEAEPWRPFESLGIPLAAIQNELLALSRLPTLDLDAALALEPLETWRNLWLGGDDDGVAGLITLQGAPDIEQLRRIAAAVPGASLVDQSGDLNSMFTATRIKAAELKLASYLAAAALLWLALGKAAVWRILAVPLCASLCTLAVMGYLGQPLTLFSLFGLLLVSAIGADYAIIMYEKVAGEAASFCGVLLAGGMTLLSFGLLSFSHTPAIANFGLSVALGIGFCVLIAPWAGFLPKPVATP